MKLELELELPAELIDQAFARQLVDRAREDIVLRLFGERRIPSGLAAEALKLTRREFIDLCERRGVALVDYTADDLRSDLAVMDRLTDLRSKEPTVEDRRG